MVYVTHGGDCVASGKRRRGTDLGSMCDSELVVHVPGRQIYRSACLEWSTYICLSSCERNTPLRVGHSVANTIATLLCSFSHTPALFPSIVREKGHSSTETVWSVYNIVHILTPCRLTSLSSTGFMWQTRRGLCHLWAIRGAWVPGVWRFLGYNPCLRW